MNSYHTSFLKKLAKIVNTGQKNIFLVENSGKGVYRENALVRVTLKWKRYKTDRKVASLKFQGDSPRKTFFSLGGEQKDHDGAMRYVKNGAKFTPILRIKCKNTQKAVSAGGQKM